MAPSPSQPPKTERTSRSRRLFVPTIILILAVLYKIYLHTVLILGFNIGYVAQPIEEFPAYECQKLEHPLLEGCEDLWLDSAGRKLYAACGDLRGRQGWCPGASQLNSSARSGSNWISVLDIDRPGADGLYGLRKLKVGKSYEGDIDLHGFDVKEMDNGVLRFWLINHRPPVDETTGEFLDAGKVGANSTIDVFDLDKSREILEHVKTIVSDAVITPNNLALEEDGNGFLITNDHSRKAGVMKELEIIVGGGSIARCHTDSGDCQIVAEKDVFLPNGINRAQDGLFYVMQPAAGKVSVHELVDGQLRLVNEIETGMPMDNASVDADGNLLVAAFPNVMGLMRNFELPEVLNVGATVLKIRKTGEVEGRAEYEVEKVVEDKEGRLLSGTTIAVRDVQSKRLFMGGILAPHVTTCKQQA